MLKVQLVNARKGRNVHVFEVFKMLSVQRALRDWGIEFVERHPDLLFVGMADFIDKHIPLEKSIEIGAGFVEGLSAPVFLFDGSDSTSLMGAYEVFARTSAWYLFKPALLSLEDYKRPSAFNKWFFGSGSPLDLAYDIPECLFSRIKVTGWNLGFYRNYQPISDVAERTVDVTAVFQVFPKGKRYNEDHGVRNDTYYTEHRTRAWTVLKDVGQQRKVVCDTLDAATTRRILRNSKLAVSPFGMGEICYRDFETVAEGCVLIKPTMESVRTLPAIYRDGVTYCAVAPDFSDLAQTSERLLQLSEAERRCLVESFWNSYKANYTAESVARYWAEILCNAKPR